VLGQPVAVVHGHIFTRSSVTNTKRQRPKKESIVNHGVRVIIHPVRDITPARALYATLLGVEPYVDEPYYVGFRLGDQELGLDPHGHQDGDGPVAYWEVDDIQESLRALLDAGAQVGQAARDVGGGKLIATVKDVDGNTIGLVQSP
jgi:predicted enzyme related to lactoylglutathione lyase